MDFLRNWLNFFLVTLLFIMIISMNLFLTLYLSLDYEKISEKIPSIIDSIPESSVNVTEIVGDVYYGEYDCGFFDCLEKGYSPLFLVSKHSRDYFRTLLLLSVLATIVLILGMFFVIETRQRFFVSVGTAFILASFPYADINLLVLLSKFIISNVFSSIVLIFLSESITIFWISFSIGVLLVILGFGLRFFGYEKIIKSQQKE